MSNFSLERLRDDPDFAALFRKKADDIRQNKHDLLSAATEYQNKYKDEINEGTRKRQLLLDEGRSKGLKDSEIFKDSRLFIPTVETPILNYLFFLLCEEGDLSADIKVLRAAGDTGTDFAMLKEQLEARHGLERHSDHETPEEIPNMVSYIYGNIGDDTMSTLKKLKTLAESDNEAEAFAAFRKGREMAKKYNLEWDRIPFNR